MRENYPLICLNDSCQVSKKTLSKLLDDKALNLAVKNENKAFSPRYLFLKTEAGKSFGVIISSETRLRKKSKKFKIGYGSNRISYPTTILNDEDLLRKFLHFKPEQLEKHEFTSLRAYILDKNEKLMEIGRVFFNVQNKGKSKIGYIDDLYVKHDEKNGISFRGKGIAKTLVRFADLLMLKQGLQKVYADVKKIDKSFGEGENFRYNYDPITPAHTILKNLGYKHEKEKVFNDKWAPNTPMVAVLPEIVKNVREEENKIIIPKKEYLAEHKVLF